MINTAKITNSIQKVGQNHNKWPLTGRLQVRVPDIAAVAPMTAYWHDTISESPVARCRHIQPRLVRASYRTEGGRAWRIHVGVHSTTDVIWSDE
jgi:hypothetical protein